MRKLYMMFFLFFFTFTLAQAQVNIPITVTDNSGNSTIINFGINPAATDGIDPALGEVSLPPNPPLGSFEARFVNVPGVTLGFGSYKDFRYGTSTSIFFGKKFKFVAQKSALATSTSIQFGTIPTGVTGTISVGGNPAIPIPVGVYALPGSASIYEIELTFDFVMTTPAVPVLYAPPSGSGIFGAQTTLQWYSSLGAASYDVEVSNDPGFSTGVQTFSGILDTSKVLTTLVQGLTYYWRVKANNVHGSSAFTTPWNFSVATAPVLNAPANGSVGVLNPITLNWFGVQDATGYSVSIDSLGFPIRYYINVTDTALFVTPDLTLGATYSWRVNAHKGSDSTSYSTIWSFTTGSSPTVVTLIAPANGSSCLTLTPVFQWTPALGTIPISYTVLLLNGSMVIDSATTSDTTLTWATPLMTNFPYIWQVRASNIAGSSLSAMWNFTTGNVPSVPVLTTPVADSTAPIVVNLIWQAAIGCAPISYAVQVFDLTTSTYAISNPSVPGTTLEVNLAAGRTYQWRVRSINSFGQSNWSGWRRFYTGPAPATPTLKSPVCDFVSPSPTVTFVWSSSVGATGYTIQIDESVSFINPLVVNFTTTDTTYTYPGTQGQVLYWRVQAVNATYLTSSPFTAACKITIGALPTAPVLSAPANNAVDVPINNTTFAWYAVPYATSYTLYYYLLDALEVMDTVVTDTTIGLPGLAEFSTYYWYVKATNSFGTSAPSATWKFRTMWLDPPTWFGNLIIKDFSPIQDSVAITFGMYAGASDGLDLGLGEYELTPMPAAGIMNARFELPGDTIYSYRDLRADSLSDVIWRYKFQPDSTGYPLVIKWNIENFPTGSLYMRDPSNTEGLGNIDMRTVSQFTLVDPNVQYLEIYYTKTICRDVTLGVNFKLVSIPLKASSMKYPSIFGPFATSMFYWNIPTNQYIQFSPDSNLVNGSGYWLNGPAGIVTICGLKVGNSIPISLRTGWNLIGIYETNVPTSLLVPSVPTLIDGVFYEWMESGTGYNSTTTLKYGAGYWVKATADGFLTINMPKDGVVYADNNSVEVNKIKETWGKISFETAAGTRTLYIDNDGTGNAQFELPPPPPPTVFDARFATGTNVENLDAPRTIVLNSATYPVKIKVDGMDVSVKDTKGGKLLNGSVRSGDYIIISDQSIKEIQISKYEVPTDFDMSQNYPNPFNPSTTIKFAIPVDSKVTVRVYDMVGQEVAQLMSEQLAAGYHQVEFNANKLSSGVYFYRIDAVGLNGKDFSSVKKMMLLK